MIWYTADLHLGHANIIKYCNRPFSSAEEMDECLILLWNEIVDTDDVVFILGDLALGKLAETLPLVTQLTGHKFLVPGNHDRCWPGHKKVRPVDIQQYQDVGLTILEPYLSMANWDVCHFPYQGDSQEEDRYAQFRPPDNGRWLLHGHVHDKWKFNGKQINVGMDVWNYRPVPGWYLEKLVERHGLTEEVITF